MKTSSRGFLKKFKFSSNTAFILEFGNKYIRFYANHGQLLKNDAVFELETPYTLDDLWDDKEEVCRLQITQNADVLYLWHKKYMKTLTRYSNTDWRLEDFELKNGPWENVNTTNTTISSSTELGETTLSASTDVFDDDDIGRLIRLNLYNDSTTPWSAGKTVSAGDVYTSDGKYYQTLGGGTTGSVKPVHTEGSRSDGGVVWEYLHAGYGTAKIKEIVSAKEAKADIIKRMPKNIQTVSWEKGLIYKGGEYPVCGTFFRNRLAMLLNTPAGGKCILSKTDDFDNFDDKDFGEVLPENAITVPILSNEYNEVRWICSGDVLFIGTNNGEFFLDVLTSSEALGTDNVKISQISSIGGKAIAPVKINGHTLFVDRFGTSIRDLVYSYERDGYDPFDASIKGKHLLKSGIVEWDFQDYPDKVLWCVVGDGRLIGFTFNTEQEVTALHQHNFSGYVESVCIIPSPDQKKDDVWLSVQRNMNGITKRYVEWIDEGTPSIFPDYIERTEDLEEKDRLESGYVKENSFYLDSALVYNRSASDDIEEISGLQHLAGMLVRIIADGAQKPDQVVSASGTVKISKNDNHVIIGLPVKAVFKAQKRYIQSNTTAGVGEVQQIDHLCLMLYRSGGGKVGGKYAELVDILYRNTDEIMGKSAALFTGNKIIPWPTGVSNLEEKGADIILVNDSVFPMTVLAVSPQMTSSES